MIAAYGAAATNHSNQVTVLPSCFSMKPIATIFCAAAVLIPIFQILAACTVAIMSNAANRLLRFSPKAAMMPSTIGARHPTRAVVLGTKNARTKPTKIIPARIRFVRAPTLDRMTSAIRLSSPVCIIAAARNNAAPTRTVPLLLIPANVILTASAVPSILAGSLRSGEKPRHTSISVAMTAALTG